MPYDEKFFKAYREYLKESVVRRNHAEMFRLFARLISPGAPCVIDLGCGSGEYHRYDARHIYYCGVDNSNAGRISDSHFIQADYMTLDFKNHIQFTPNSFISLFSIECCQPEVKNKYDLYERIFKEFTDIRTGLVSGFFYESKRNEPRVEEAGEIMSYQTIEDPSLWISDTFTEMRIHLHTPSQMFGQDVVEVWKIFIRKDQRS